MIEYPQYTHPALPAWPDAAESTMLRILAREAAVQAIRWKSATGRFHGFQVIARYQDHAITLCLKKDGIVLAREIIML